MADMLKIEDVDILGLIKVEPQDISGIERFVTPLRENQKVKSYYSRSKEYYNVKTLGELSEDREYLKNQLTTIRNKRNFVILENMLNCSGRVYFKLFEQFILNRDTRIQKAMIEAKKCMDEDTKNIVKILQNEGLISVTGRRLPKSSMNCIQRPIEMDNKALLYLFAKSIELPKEKNNIEILTPGYGSIYMGPFLKQIHGVDYTNMYKSDYKKDTPKGMSEKQFTEVLSTRRALQKDIILLDDNIGTGKTILNIRKQLEANKIKTLKMGAVQYNWRNFYRITIHDKEDIDKFDPENFDYVTPSNYPGHNLLDHAIEQLMSSGEDYEQYKKDKGYSREDCCDIEGSMRRGIRYARKSNLNITRKKVMPNQNLVSESVGESVRNFINVYLSEKKSPEPEKVFKNHIR